MTIKNSTVHPRRVQPNVKDVFKIYAVRKFTFSGLIFAPRDQLHACIVLLRIALRSNLEGSIYHKITSYGRRACLEKQLQRNWRR